MGDKTVRVVLAVTAMVIALLLTTCGGRKSATIAQPHADATYSAPVTQADVSLQETLAELEKLILPEGVDAVLFQLLKDELAIQLREKGTDRVVSTPPTGEANKVTDLALADNHDGTYTLTWHYRNAGDYDQDGTVNIADITPLAMHYGESAGDENSLNGVIDGDENGSIGISDITPLAMNYGANLDCYRVEASATYFSGFLETDEVRRTEGSGDGRLQFAATVPDTSGTYFRVIPLDDSHAAGIASKIQAAPETPPTVVSVSPAGGIENESVTFSAVAVGSEPLYYTWDFDGGATPDYSSAVSPTVTLGSPGDYSASLTVTNDYGDHAYPFTLHVSAAPPEPADWHVMIYVGADNNLASDTVNDFLSQEEFESTEDVIVTIAIDLNGEPFGGNRFAGFFYVGEDETTDTELNGESFNSALPSSLASYLSWAKQHWPAEQYCLFMYDHGGSWTKNSSGIIIDDTSNRAFQMEIDDLAAVIRNSGLPIRVLVFRACIMASIEVMVDLADTVDYVVASQTSQYGAPYPLDDIVSLLQETPSTTPATLASMVSQYYKLEYSDLRYSTVSSTIDLSAIPDLVYAVENLVPALNNYASENLATVMAAYDTTWRNRICEGDLGDFLELLLESVEDPALAGLLTLAKMSLQAAVMSSQICYVPDDLITEDVRYCTGLNVYMPLSEEYDEFYRSQYRTLEFDASTGWSGFLDQLNPSAQTLTIPGGEMWGMIAWEPGLPLLSGPELDLYVWEPTWNPEEHWIASPALGSTSLNGYLSADSFWSLVAWEAWMARPRIYKGSYVFLVDYYSNGLLYSGAYVEFLGYALGEEFYDGPYYLSHETTYDDDLGPGWILFAICDRITSSETSGVVHTLRELGLTDSQIASIKAQLNGMAERKKRRKRANNLAGSNSKHRRAALGRLSCRAGN